MCVSNVPDVVTMRKTISHALVTLCWSVNAGSLHVVNQDVLGVCFTPSDIYSMFIEIFTWYGQP